MPASQLELVNITDWQANVARANAAVAAAATTPRGRARLALAAALFPLPDWWEVGTPRPARDDYAARWANQLQALQFQLAFIFGFRQEVEQRAGGNGSWNVGVDYARLLARSASRDLVGALYRGLDLRGDLRLLAKGRRVRPDLRATAYLVRNVVYDGRIPVPVLTVHTTDDGLVVSPHERAYRDAVRRAGRGRLLEQLWVDRPGHCTFTDAETLAALRRAARAPRPRALAQGLRERVRRLRAAAVPAAVRSGVARSPVSGQAPATRPIRRNAMRRYSSTASRLNRGGYGRRPCCCQPRWTSSGRAPTDPASRMR